MEITRVLTRHNVISHTNVHPRFVMIKERLKRSFFHLIQKENGLWMIKCSFASYKNVSSCFSVKQQNKLTLVLVFSSSEQNRNPHRQKSCLLFSNTIKLRLTFPPEAHSRGPAADFKISPGTKANAGFSMNVESQECNHRPTGGTKYDQRPRFNVLLDKHGNIPPSIHSQQTGTNLAAQTVAELLSLLRRPQGHT